MYPRRGGDFFDGIDDSGIEFEAAEEFSQAA